MYQIAASILSADFAYLAEDVKAVVAAGVDTIHFDVMDLHYVPNLTVGAMVCRALREAGITATIDVHLMVSEPQKLIVPFAEAGADILSFHPETVSNVAQTVDEIQQAGLQVGLVYNPDQEVDASDALLNKVDMLLLMSVFPGFGGQKFIPGVLDKVAAMRARLDSVQSKAVLAIDGGVKVDNIASIAASGADYFVLGSGLFSAEDYVMRINALRQALEHVASD